VASLDINGDVLHKLCDVCGEREWTWHGWVSGLETYACATCAHEVHGECPVCGLDLDDCMCDEDPPISV
jgi:hypothetical protein